MRVFRSFYQYVRTYKKYPSDSQSDKAIHFYNTSRLVYMRIGVFAPVSVFSLTVSSLFYRQTVLRTARLCQYSL